MRFAIAATALLALAACEKSPTAPADTFLVTATATPTLLKAGGVTTVIVGITNLSSVPKTFDANFCGPAYRVYSAGGTVMNVIPNGACAAVYIPKTLAPGEQAVYAAQWTTVGIDSVGHATVPLPAGIYTIRGVDLTGPDASHVNNSPATVQLVP